jgi:uncharacterized membrane protein YhaH (DUF805 family)
MHYYFDVLKRYWDFNGRTARKEFWMFALITTIISIALMIIDLVIGTQIVLYQPATFGGDTATGIAPITPAPIEIGMLQNIYTLAVFLPSLGVAVRRLHDTGRSGWWWLMNFICCVGWIVLLVFYVTRGTVGDNKYGPDPLSTN